MVMKSRIRFFLVLLVAGVAGLTSCKKDVVRHQVLSREQLVAGRMDGTWTNPSNIVTPENVPPDVFGNMRLVFTTDESGNPLKFLAQDCQIIFGNTGAGTWTINGTEESAKVNLKGIGPVDEFDIRVGSSTLTLSFYMGWENTDTQEKGQGDFRVTLTRQ